MPLKKRRNPRRSVRANDLPELRFRGKAWHPTGTWHALGEYGAFRIGVVDQSKQFTVVAVDPFGDVRGYVTANAWNPDRAAPEPECWHAYDRLRQQLGARGPQALWFVNFSGVDGDHRGTGLGTVLYAAAARWAAEHHSAALGPDDCQQGGTSEEAYRVWQGRRFSAMVERSGPVVFWRGASVRQNPRKPLDATHTIDLDEQLREQFDPAPQVRHGLLPSDDRRFARINDVLYWVRRERLSPEQVRERARGWGYDPHRLTHLSDLDHLHDGWLLTVNIPGEVRFTPAVVRTDTAPGSWMSIVRALAPAPLAKLPVAARLSPEGAVLERDTDVLRALGIAGYMQFERMLGRWAELARARRVTSKARSKRQNPSSARKDRPRPEPVKVHVYADGTGVDVVAEAPDRREVARLAARLYDWTGCDQDAKRAGELAGRRHVRHLVVEHSNIYDLRYVGTGLGVELYLAAARAGAEQLGAALLQHRCIGGGGTSDLAMRVWDSSRFNAQVRRVGWAAYWTGPR